MENVTYEINGYTVTFKSSLSFGQKRQIKRHLLSGMSLDAETNITNTNINGSLVLEAQDLTLKMLLVSLKTPDGKLYEGEAAFDAIQNFDSKDAETGDEIYKKINQVTSLTALSEDKKK